MKPELYVCVPLDPVRVKARKLGVKTFFRDAPRVSEQMCSEYRSKLSPNTLKSKVDLLLHPCTSLCMTLQCLIYFQTCFIISLSPMFHFSSFFSFFCHGTLVGRRLKKKMRVKQMRLQFREEVEGTHRGF